MPQYKDTYLFSPIVTEGLCPFSKGSFSYKTWWNEQRIRCLDGYTVDGVRVTGDYYWYLNFWKILGTEKGTKRKTLISPRFTTLDKEFFDEKERAEKNNKGLVVAKVRQCGYSEKAASLAGKEFSFRPYSQTLIIGGEKKYAEDTFNKVTRGLRSLKGTAFYKRTVGDFDLLEAKFKPKGSKEYKGYFSQLIGITCQDNHQATVGKTPSLALFEEAGKFKNLIASFDYIKPAFFNEGQLVTFFLVFGTGGEMGSGAEQLMQMFYNPSGYVCQEYEDIYSEDYSPSDVARKKVGLFVPAWKYKILDKDGNIMIDESIKYIQDARDVAKTNAKVESYFKEITQNPIHTEECFLISEGKVFNSAKLNQRLSQLKKFPKEVEAQKRVRLEWVRDEARNIIGVESFEEPDGKFLIIEPPILNGNGQPVDGLYKGATDSYDRDEAVGGGSKGSCGIIKGFYNANTTSRKFVARITERPETAPIFFENTAKLCMYYGALNLIEYSNLLIFNWYKNNNLEYMLRERPEIAYSNVKNSGMQNKYGVDPSTKSEWISMLRDYIEDYYHLLDDEEQITAFLKYRIAKDYNCDITIQSALNIVHLQDDQDLLLKKDVQPEKNRFFTRGFKTVNGQITTYSA
jgi:hypothetical protein